MATRRPHGRVFSGRRKVRLGDVDRHGRLRLDALTRYTQDVSDDDTTDAGLDPEPGWVVRSTVVDELAPAELGQWLHIETFCSGLGGRWAERRLTITVGDDGGDTAAVPSSAVPAPCYEVATLWVCIDPLSGRPHRLTEQFEALYGEAAGDRKVSARQVNPALPPDTDPSRCRAWQVRAVDFDVYGHVNNAAYWAAVEQWAGQWSGPRRARLEYGAGLAGIDQVEIVVDDIDGGTAQWWLAPIDGTEAGGDAGRGQGGCSDRETIGEAVASASVIDLPAVLDR